MEPFSKRTVFGPAEVLFKKKSSGMLFKIHSNLKKTHFPILLTMLILSDTDVAIAVKKLSHFTESIVYQVIQLHSYSIPKCISSEQFILFSCQ